MKLSNEALVEVIAIVAEGLANNEDISQKLRELDLVVQPEGGVKFVEPALLALSQEYVAAHPRATSWDEGSEDPEAV